MNFDCGIYAITSPSGKQYIGQAKSIKKRWIEHRHLLRNGKHHCPGLQRAFNKYGESGLNFSIIAFVPSVQLNLREQEQIDARDWDLLYNVALCAEAPARGLRLSEERRKAISERQMGERNPRFGKPHTAESRALMSLARKGKLTGEMHPGFGKPRSPETLKKLSEVRVGRFTGADSPVARAVVCVETGETFVSIAEAVKWIRSTRYPKATHSLISTVCSGGRRIAYGYHWQYATVPHVYVRVYEYATKEAA